MGAQAWILVCIILSEALLCYKWSIGIFKNPFPYHVKIFWSIFLPLILVIVPMYQFVNFNKMKLKNLQFSHT